MVAGDWTYDTGRLLTGGAGSILAYRCGALSVGAVVTLGFASIVPGLTVYVAASEDFSTGIEIEFLSPAALGSADPCVNVTVRQDGVDLWSTDMGTEYFIDVGDFVTGTPRGLVAGIDVTDPDHPRILAGATTLDFDQVGATLPAGSDLWVGFGIPAAGGGGGTMEITKVFIDLNGGDRGECCAAPNHSFQCWEGSACGKPPTTSPSLPSGRWTTTATAFYEWLGPFGWTPGDWWAITTASGSIDATLTLGGGDAVHYFLTPLPPCYDTFTGDRIESGPCGSGRAIKGFCGDHATTISRVFRLTECAEVTISAEMTRGMAGIGTAAMSVRIYEDGCKNPRTGTGYLIWEGETESGPSDDDNCITIVGDPPEGYQCNTSRCATESADTIDHVLTLSPGFYLIELTGTSNVRCICYRHEGDPLAWVEYTEYSPASFVFSIGATGLEIVEECE